MERAFTETQGQYLAFICYYTKIHDLPPAEADMLRYSNISASSVHNNCPTAAWQEICGKKEMNQCFWDALLSSSAPSSNAAMRGSRTAASRAALFGSCCDQERGADHLVPTDSF
jgi:hypothetical protein